MAVRAVLRDAAVILGISLLAAVVAGLVWPHLVSPVEVVRTETGLSTGELDLANRFDDEAWFALLGAGLGLVLGAVLTAWRRAHDVATVLLVLAGAALGAWAMARIGTWAGPPDPMVALRDADVGATAQDQVLLRARAALYVWPTAALLGALLVLWTPERHHHGRHQDHPGN